jgi:hypothetical protein
VDLVGIEPTTSSMPWNPSSSRSLILKKLNAGQGAKNRYKRRNLLPKCYQDRQVGIFTIVNIVEAGAVGESALLPSFFEWTEDLLVMAASLPAKKGALPLGRTRCGKGHHLNQRPLGHEIRN